MSIKIEYIVCNKKGEELKRFDAKSEAEAYDSVICAAEDICVILEPIQSELSLTEEQLFTISEHLAFQADEVKLALKQIKKPKAPSTTKTSEPKADAENDVVEQTKKKNKSIYSEIIDFKKEVDRNPTAQDNH